MIGWALDRTLEAALTIKALAHGVGAGADPVVRSECITPIAACSTPAHDYKQFLQGPRHPASACRGKRNPWDNAPCESFMKTLKYEEVYRSEYRHLAEAQASLGIYLEKAYNQKRLHSALGYLPPGRVRARVADSENHKEAATHQPSL